ncbi:phage tail protein [Microbulbifer thermotolerans]|uniref:phage tail protein n=1 Tax=Microbulbifer thermotolerans TaxID=252514 RepID=UPI002671BD7B|nr:phage tail protein [Microbulbifer thermotolerans]WKT59096.1 phage tail protein [Microbulbifer thermotolerans]
MSNSAYTVSSVVAEICERAGLPFGKFDTTLLDGYVWGMQITNEQAAYEHLQTLADAYFFDISNRGGVVTFVPRGGEPVREISEDDLIGDSADEVTRKSPEEIVRVLNLNYYDLDGGIDTDKQTSDRSIDTRGEGEETVNSPLVLETDFAARQVAIAHKVMIEEQKGDLSITLPDSYLDLTPGDVVKFRDDRLRVDEVNIDVGKQQYKLVYDRKSAYQSQAFGIPPVPAPPPVSHVPGPTTIQFIDSHILSSGDDTQLGYYMAISGQSSAWRGAVVELSLDGGQSYIQSRTRTVSQIMGELITPLRSHKREIPDPVNTCQVQILTPNSMLENRTLAQMLNRQNRALIGNEIINFGEAEEVSPGVWEIGYFLRGRLGTEIPAEHPTGTRFVLLSRNYLEYIATDAYNIGQNLTFRATSIGSSTETTITETFTAQSQTERAPSQLRARRDDGNLIIEWFGVGNHGGRNAVLHSQYFTGYRVDVGGNITDTQSETLTVPDPGSPTTIRVHQINSITGPGPAAEITV